MSRQSRPIAVVLAAAISAGAPVTAVASVFGALAAELEASSSSPQVLSLRHSIRNHRAMFELVQALPEQRRPTRILYLASGSHIAPLAACAALPTGTPCSLVFTELDPTVQEGLHAILERCERARVVTELSASEPIAPSGGRRQWTFRLAGRPVTLELVVRAPSDDGAAPSLIEPGQLTETDLVISHDWSGDQLGNLQVIHELLSATRAGGLARVPMLMIEDLESHLYPVDLSLFVPLARSRQPYGHRASSAGVGRHGAAELGTPLYGGGVVLGFDVGWWREVDSAARAAVFDLLLLSAYDDQRQNVLEGGAEPVLAPTVLDWWTGFGRRTVSGQDLAQGPAVRRSAVEESITLLPQLPPELGRRLACRVRLYRCLLEARAAGVEVRSLMPAAHVGQRLRPEDFPSEEMRTLHREAMRHLREMRADDRRAVEDVAPLLERLRSVSVTQATAACPCSLPAAAPPTDGESWAAAYRVHLAWLDGGY